MSKIQHFAPKMVTRFVTVTKRSIVVKLVGFR